MQMKSKIAIHVGLAMHKIKVPRFVHTRMSKYAHRIIATDALLVHFDDEKSEKQK